MLARFATQNKLFRMPWLKTTQQPFTELCTRCGDCIKACPQSIIRKGDGGFPQIDFLKGECTFCQQCALACREPLFEKKLNALPWVALAQIHNTCLTHQSVVCQSCQDVCDTHAIRFQSRLGAVAQPQIVDHNCTGCGACVSSCPTRAISVLIREEEKAHDV